MEKYALVSVFDKTGILPFCEGLAKLGYVILSTGNTAKHLAEAGVPVKTVESHTGFAEILDGRVKTLHPRIHGGLLARRDNPEHMAALAENEIDVIDVVVVNLYPFEQTIARKDVTVEEAIEMIDIGGPSMLRSAAKNHEFCLPVVDPADYNTILTALQTNAVTLAFRRELAAKVFRVTSEYDARISAYITQVNDVAEKSEVSEERTWPTTWHVGGVSKQALRYGENPHQMAHFYQEPNASAASIARAVQWQGKELSYNNIQDADAALTILRSFDDFQQPVAVAVKHMNPCGIGLGATTLAAFEEANAADPVSIFGGIVALNRPIDATLAARLTELFLEIVIAPGVTPDAHAVLERKKNLRVLTVDMTSPLWNHGDVTWKRVSGGFLVQEVDRAVSNDWRVVTKRQPTDEEWTALRFAWRTVAFVKSNAIVLASDTRTLGIGAGQMNRVGAAQIAIAQAGELARGSAMGSDAFFPMRDTVDVAAAAGVMAIVQPGGSIRDEESIQAADEHGIAMVFTGERHFLH